MLGVAWLGVFGFSAVPVFMFYNIWSTCEVIKSPQTNGTAGVEQICVDIRQYGTSCAVRDLCSMCICGSNYYRVVIIIILIIIRMEKSRRKQRRLKKRDSGDQGMRP